MTGTKTETIVALNRYQILSEIGSGPMSRVYRAMDPLLGREIALKTIEIGLALDPDLKERFQREAQIGARLQHPNIVTVFDMGEADGHSYIAMELLEGENLRKRIRSRQSLPVKTKLAAIAQACEGLAYAHRSGIVHRDIKPSNLFLTAQGRMKILDFGIARLAASRLTIDGRVLGTPDYMAPEQISGQQVDGRSDLFSMAIALFEWLVWEHPFQDTVIPRRIVNGEPVRLVDADSSLPEPLAELLAKGLAKNAADRYQTGDEMAAALQAIIETLPAQETVNGGAVRQPPPGEDAGEWRISQFLDLLEELESAMEAGAAGVSREVMAKIEEAVGSDERFAVALADCRLRLQRLEESQRTTGAPPASVSGKLDATKLFAEPIARFEPDPVPRPMAVAEPPARFQMPKRQSTQLLVALGLFLGSLVLVGVVLRAFTAPAVYAVSPSVGTARVTAASATVVASPNGRSATITRLKKGDRLNILSYPSARPPDWIMVQYADQAKPSPPGYLPAKDLGLWSNVAFVELFDPGDSASPVDREEYVAKLKDYVAGSGDAYDADRAKLDLAGQQLMLARHAKNMGRPQAEIDALTAAADETLRSLKPEALDRPPAKATRAALDELRPPPSTPPNVAPAEIQFTRELDFRRATAAWQNGEYARAKRALGRILRANPQDAEAQKMLQRVLAAEQVDPGVVK